MEMRMLDAAALAGRQSPARHVHPAHSVATPKQEAYIRSVPYEGPVMVFDLDILRAKYRALSTGLGDASIHYAVKANPAPEVISTLHALGSRFDAASRGEIELCLGLGVPAEHIAFGNTIKRAADIAWAHSIGVRQFAVDAEAEVRKVATHAPGARVLVRLLIEESEADWPLCRKFGAPAREALRLMDLARFLGLEVAGLSFHAGSQLREPAMWRSALDAALALWNDARAAGHSLWLLNIGGGFPAFYGQEMPPTKEYAAEVMAMVRARFGNEIAVMAEPGRGLVAEAGLIVAEVLLVARKSEGELARWVYLDIGKFSGLAETMEEAIRYQFETAHTGETGACILAGPSCDSADVLYEKRPVQLPLALRDGDLIRILSSGAYTSSYSSVGFNGFPPLRAVYLD